ncbi:hypothetical protein M8818_000708 [Zalaria obscura]|uniref:Uncharacterized protein n=1 Tax=Zalaria obscura TaxID=2024903 RepID=A0ACC3SM73_9PEZI
MPDEAKRPQPAAVEDYNSDDGEAVPYTKQTAAKVANVAARRVSQQTASRKSRESTTRPVPRDAASDSGYSSHTNATVASGESGIQSARTVREEDVRREEAIRQPLERRPTLTQSRRESRARSPAKEGSRPASRSRRVSLECKDPNCPDCQKLRRRESSSRRPLPSPLDRPQEYTFSQPAYPSYAYPQVSPVLQSPPTFPPRAPLPTPAQFANARPRAYTTSRGRPQSYHAGVNPAVYWSSGYAGLPPGYGLPQSAAQPEPWAFAHPYQQPAPYQYASSNTGVAPSNTGAYGPVSPTLSSPTSPTSPGGRPLIIPQASETYSARRPNQAYGRPIVTQNLPRSTSYTYSPATQPPARRDENRQRYSVPGAYESAYDTDSEDDRVRRHDRDRDRDLMPPPLDPPSHRPSLKHHSTTSAVLPLRRSKDSLPIRTLSTREIPRLDTSNDTKYVYDRDRDGDRNRSRSSRDRRTSSSRPRRPSLATTSTNSTRTNPTSYTTSSSGGRADSKIIVEPSSGRARRASYLAGDQRTALERQKERIEAYQERMGGGTSTTTDSAEALRRAKAAELPALTHRGGGGGGGGSKEGSGSVSGTAISSSSGGSHGHGHSRASRSHRSRHSVALSTHDEASRISRTDSGIRIEHQGTNIHLVGDLEGRRIQVRPHEDGVGTEIVVGGHRGERERTYVVRSRSRAGRTRSRTESQVGERRRESRFGEYERVV